MHESDLKALKDYVKDNDTLTHHKPQITNFNFFYALRIADHEIRHSNFLAWLLNPYESHGQGDLLLRAVLLDLLHRAPPNRKFITSDELSSRPMHDIEVRREWQHLDLLITCRDPSLLIAVENKVLSREHSDQLTRYRKLIENNEQLSGYANKLFVFLSRLELQPSDQQWMSYGYEDLSSTLRLIEKQFGIQMRAEIRSAIRQYLEVLDRWTSSTNRLGVFAAAVTKAIDSHPDDWDVYHARESVKFQPASWGEWLPVESRTNHKDPRKKQYWIFFSLVKQNDEIYLNLGLTNTRYAELLKRAVSQLLRHHVELGITPIQVDRNNPKNSTFSVCRVGHVPSSIDSEIDISALNPMIHHALDHVTSIEQRLREKLQETI